MSSSLPEQYIRLDKIGEGTYATVHRARDIQTNHLVALKDIFISTEEGCPSTALREIALLKDLAPHPNIVRLLNVLHAPDGASLTLVFEHCEEDLKQYMDRMKGRLPLEEIAALARQLVIGVAACHSKGIIHRDLKPQNLLIQRIKSGAILKLADFGLARGTGIPVAQYSHEVVTLWYRAPELLLGAGKYGGEIDMWAIGCIVAEMLRGGQPIVPGKSAGDQLSLTWRILGAPTIFEANDLEHAVGRQLGKEECPRALHESLVNGPTAALLHANTPAHAAAIDFCRGCLQYSPARRLTAQEALVHPFLR